MSPTPPVPWEKFSGDPRDPAVAGLRASDADRDVAHETLNAAFADGRLDRQELEDRTDVVNGARTLGTLADPLRDLAPDRAVRPASEVRYGGGTVSEAEVTTAAQSRYEAARRSALGVFLAPTLICWAIWLITSMGSGFYYPWPIWVTLGTSFRLIQVLANKGSFVESERRRVERRERHLERRRDRGNHG